MCSTELLQKQLFKNGGDPNGSPHYIFKVNIKYDMRFSVRNIKNMKKFYLELSGDEKVQTASAQILWSHSILNLNKIKNKEEFYKR